MNKIASFTIDHTKLLPGLYVSRKDRVGSEVITTFDLRITRPNYEPVMGTAEMHTIEHLAATYLRNDPDWGHQILYFGPMGCRTGFYLIVAGDYESKDILTLVMDCCNFIVNFIGKIPGASPVECGNCWDTNLPMARYWATHYFRVLNNIEEDQLVYPKRREEE